VISSFDDKFARVKVGRLALWALAGIVVVAVVRIMAPRLSSAALGSILIYVVYALLAAAAVRSCRQAGIRIGEVIGPPPELRDLGTVLILVPLLILVALLSVWLTVYLLSWIAPALVVSLMARQRDSLIARGLVPGGGAFLLVFGIVVVAPAVEEFVFRGLLLRRWMARHGLWRGVLWSALVFAILHPQDLIGTFVIGVVFALLYLATRSLLAPILAHGLINGVVSFVALNSDRLGAPADASNRTLTQLQSEWGAPVIMFVVISALLAAAVRPLIVRVESLT
jgi:membrane protease YdiL (CAAX protease family)